jgi:hypothetical protein
MLFAMRYPIVAKIFPKIFFVSFNSDGGRTSPLVIFAPPPNPPPRRGEGRVGVRLLEIFMHIAQVRPSRKACPRESGERESSRGGS